MSDKNQITTSSLSDIRPISSLTEAEYLSAAGQLSDVRSALLSLNMAAVKHFHYDGMALDRWWKETNTMLSTEIEGGGGLQNNRVFSPHPDQHTTYFCDLGIRAADSKQLLQRLPFDARDAHPSLQLTNGDKWKFYRFGERDERVMIAASTQEIALEAYRALVEGSAVVVAGRNGQSRGTK